MIGLRHRRCQGHGTQAFALVATAITRVRGAVPLWAARRVSAPLPHDTPKKCGKNAVRG
jgi:hypothetical protein